MKENVFDSRWKILANVVFDIVILILPQVNFTADLPNTLNNFLALFSLIAFILFAHHLIPSKKQKKPLVRFFGLFGTQEIGNSIYKISTKTESNNKVTHQVVVGTYSQYKAMTMLVVVQAILAVDLPTIFDRKMCKTEEFGASLMDVGVALITLNSGMTSRKARPWIKTATIKDTIKDLLNSFLGVIMPILAGFTRLLLISDLDYQEHSSEWGIHWNFYTTIALINLLQAFLRDSTKAIVFAITLIMFYQCILVQYDLVSFVFFAPRIDFVSANREGLFSLVGYYAL